ncbi:hypothetical protein QUB40_00705 [Microcoleus sp. AT9_A2]|uniref:hypothetical protein n=1 Tax=Microcoleus sp. AT9_A2 TaxID=2818624 RepID=UPI002FD4549D
MAIVIEKNSLNYIASFSPIRCDTHFKHNIEVANEFFSNKTISWVALGSVLEKVQNGMNIKTDYYSMEETDTLYLSVSQIKEYGLIDKNQNYLTDEVKELNSYFELAKNMILITRSGTIGVALSTNHSSFNFDDYSYVASGFVITAKVKEGFSANAIAGYINLFNVQKYLTAMAAGACQKNIAQPIINNLPIPECLLNSETDIEQDLAYYEKESRKIIECIALQEKKLSELKSQVSALIKDKIISLG